MTAVNIPKLKVRARKVVPAAKCAEQMAALTACWSTTSVDNQRCAAATQALIICVQKAKRPHPAKSDINYHLSRLSKQVLGK
ncbi:hypothetical protein H4S06_003320 [Coemansia sp. BCRC 34490]|nr:hypothetical protein H4S06_003320 [Coemansia sp. BCRC 34490]